MNPDSKVAGWHLRNLARPSIRFREEQICSSLKRRRFNPEETLRRNPERRFLPGGQTLNVGVWIETSLSRSTGSGLDGRGNVNSLSAGPFIKGKLGRFTNFDLGAGVNLIDATPSVPVAYYVSGVIRHQIVRHWQAIFSAAHDFFFTSGTALTEETSFRLRTQLDVTRRITFSASGFFNFGDQKSGVNPGSYRQYGLALDLGRKPRRRWSTGVSYDLTRRDGASTSTSYLENLVTFKLSYLF